MQFWFMEIWLDHTLLWSRCRAEPTASAVVADIIDIARQTKLSQNTLIPSLGFMPDKIQKKNILSIENIFSEFYLAIYDEKSSRLACQNY